MYIAQNSKSSERESLRDDRRLEALKAVPWKRVSDMPKSDSGQNGRKDLYAYMSCFCSGEWKHYDEYISRKEK